MYDDQTQIGVVSITNYAQSSLGDVVYVELPQEGSEISQGGECYVYIRQRHALNGSSYA